MIVGFNRCLSVTLPTLEAKVIEPIIAAGHDVSVDIVVSRTRASIVNPRSEEFGHAEWDLPPEASRFRTKTLNARLLNLRVTPRFFLAKRRGDPWPESHFTNLRNLVNVLKVQHIAAQWIDDSADLIFFLRPDLMPVDTFDISRYADTAREAVVVPYWHPYRGVNDRLALMPPSIAHRYLERWQLIPHYLRKGKKLHSERFLKYVLRNVRVEPIMVERFNRMRIGGVELQEDFMQLIDPKIPANLGIIPDTNGDYLPRQERR